MQQIKQSGDLAGGAAALTEVWKIQKRQKNLIKTKGLGISRFKEYKKKHQNECVCIRISKHIHFDCVCLSFLNLEMPKPFVLIEFFVFFEFSRPPSKRPPPPPPSPACELK